MPRITNKDLIKQVARINELLETDTYELDSAYGGVKLIRKDGWSDVLNCGYTTKRKLYDLMAAFIDGIKAAKGI